MSSYFREWGPISSVSLGPGGACLCGASLCAGCCHSEMALPSGDGSHSAERSDQALGCSEQGNAENAEITSRAAEEDQLGSRGQSHWRTNIRDGQKRKGRRA